MNSLLDGPFLAALWSQLWQVTMLIVVVGVTARLVARHRPHLAHVLWLVVLLKCLTPPWLASPGGLFSQAEGWLVQESNSEVSTIAAITPKITLDFGADLSLRTDQSRVYIACNTPVESAWNWTTWGMLALAVSWTLGTIYVATRFLCRWRRFRRLIRRPACQDTGPYDAVVARLARRLGVRRSVRLRITASRVGPVVVGWIRPVIVLPEVLIHGRPACELEPILAHELIHLRRGDTWVGLLRMAVQVVWWFHPLVRWADRLVSSEAERCCDEAVVAELGLRPAEYARCLLGVLERKHLLTPVPAFPGVRPVEVTSKRMERIMKLGQGCRRRSPWWCYAVMIVAAAAVLPGAAWVAVEEEETVLEPVVEVQVRPFAPVPTSAPETKPIELDEATRKHLKALQEEFGDELVCIEYYPVGDILAEMQSKLKVTKHKAKTYLVRRLVYEFYRKREPNDPVWLRWHGKQLEVTQTMEGQQQVGVILESMRKYGFRQILIHICWISPSPDEIEPLMPASSVFGRSEFSRSNIETVQSEIFTFDVLDQEQAEAFIKRVNELKSARVLASPVVVTTNGCEACFRVGASKSFVIGFKDDKPDVKTVRPGLSVDVKPLLLDSGRVRLDCQFRSTVLHDVQVKKVKHPTTEEMVDVEIPRVNTREIETGVEMRLGQTMVISGMEKETGPGKREKAVITLRAELVAPDPPVQRR